MYLLLQNLDKTLIKTSVFKNPLQWSLSWLPLPWEQPGMLGVGLWGRFGVLLGAGTVPCPQQAGFGPPGLVGTVQGLCSGVGSQHDGICRTPMGQCCPWKGPEPDPGSGRVWEGSPSFLLGWAPARVFRGPGQLPVPAGHGGAELSPLPSLGPQGASPWGAL